MTLRETLITLDDFEGFIARPENTNRIFELIDGGIVEKVPTEEHSLISGNLYIPLRLFAEQHDLGRAAFEVRRQMPGDDHNARLPDVEFTSKERLLPVVKQGAVPQMPDLAVEITSPDDSYLSLREKALYYLKHGARLVWLVFPEKQQIEVHTADAVRTIGIADVLDGGEVLPGFRLPVAAVFRLA